MERQSPTLDALYAKGKKEVIKGTRTTDDIILL